MAKKKVIGKIKQSDLNMYCEVCPINTRRISFGASKKVTTTPKDLLIKKRRCKSPNGITFQCEPCNGQIVCPLKDDDVQAVYVTENASTISGCKC